MVAFARPGSDTLVLLPMHQPCVAKVCCCSTNRPVPTEGRGGSADGRISDRDSLFTREAQAVPCHRANECRRIGICQESTTVSTDLPTTVSTYLPQICRSTMWQQQEMQALAALPNTRCSRLLCYIAFSWNESVCLQLSVATLLQSSSREGCTSYYVAIPLCCWC